MALTILPAVPSTERAQKATDQDSSTDRETIISKNASGRRYLALLRGINVGGKNIIRMADLKACLEECGFNNVVTFIQSGNVIFRSPAGKGETTKKIEKVLSDRFLYESRLVLVSFGELKRVVEGAPKGFGSEPDKYRYEVIFLKAPVTAASAIKSISIKEGVDFAQAGKGVLYHSRLTERATQSRLSRIVQLPIYKNMTIRNWNTTTKLLALMEKD